LSTNAGLKQLIGKQITSASVCDRVRITLATRLGAGGALGRRRREDGDMGLGFGSSFFGLRFSRLRAALCWLWQDSSMD
jgi:hypothetical protein